MRLASQIDPRYVGSHHGPLSEHDSPGLADIRILGLGERHGRLAAPGRLVTSSFNPAPRRWQG
jgi:hypothetical protein